MFFNFTEILSVTMVLFAVIDILGSIPIILSLREKVGHIQSEKASIVALFIMIVFLFAGNSIGEEGVELIHGIMEANEHIEALASMRYGMAYY